MMKYIETERLILRSWKDEDLSVFTAMNKNPKVMEYFPSPLSEEESFQLYHRIQNELDTLGYGLYAVEEKSTSQFVGYIGFHKATFVADFTPCVEIGWRLSDIVWGRGYATEGAIACLEYGFQILNFEKIYSFTAVINKRSERVMKKIGMVKIGEFDHPNVKADDRLLRHVLYKIEN